MKLCYPITGPESESISMAMGGDFDTSLRALHKIGYQGIELMIRDAKRIDTNILKKQLKANKLEIAAVGVAPMVLQDKFTIAHKIKRNRDKAMERAIDAIDLASNFNAPFCIGSFRGFIDEKDENNDIGKALKSFQLICNYAKKKNVSVLMEPQSTANGNYINTLEQGLHWIDQVNCENLFLILDFFHIAGNEISMFKNIEKIKNKFKLVHVCDNKRLMMGYGNLPIVDFIAALIAQGYEGYFSTEIKQLPDPFTAAKMTFAYFDYLQKVILNES